jgi:hypothetical protein
MLDRTSAEQLLNGLSIVLEKIRNAQIRVFDAIAETNEVDKKIAEDQIEDLKFIQNDIMNRLASFKGYVDKTIVLIEKRRKQQIEDNFRARLRKVLTSDEQQKLLEQKQLGGIDPSIGKMIQEFMGVSRQRPTFIGLSPEQRRSRQSAYLREHRKSVDEYERPTLFRADSA